jgi:hypothetical protein
MIKKSKKGYTVVSKTHKKEMGTYPSKKQAIKRMLQVEWFKNKKA